MSKNIRLAFDMRTNHRSGIYRYGISLLEMLINTEQNLDITIIQNKNTILPKPIVFSQKNFVVPDDGCFVRRSTELCNWLHNNADIYYSPNYLVDFQIDIPFIFTIHDLTRLKFPLQSSYTDKEFINKFGYKEYQLLINEVRNLRKISTLDYQRSISHDYFNEYFWRANSILAKKAYQVNTVSTSTKKDIENILDIPGDKIQVIPNSVSSFFTKSKVDVRSNILFVGQANKRKRVDWLFSGISKIQSQFDKDKLLFIGRGLKENKYLHGLINNHYLENIVDIFDDVSDLELVSIYQKSKATIISSIDEGFCLPALESISCGTEVIAPNLPAIREVIGDKAHYYNVWDQDELVKLIYASLKNELPPKAEEYVNSHTWELSAKLLLKQILDYEHKDNEMYVAK